MRAKTQLRILKALLVVFLVVLAISVYHFFSDLPDLSGRSESDYDYQSIQTMVTVAPAVPDTGPAPPSYDADELRGVNSDFRGWLQIPDTTINYPVVQGEDNSFYLKHAFTKEYSQFGSLFLDASTQDTDRSRVIHGHNMGINRDEMFSPLVDYQDPAYAQEHQTIFYSDPNRPGEEEYTVFSVLNLNIYNKDGFNYRQQAFDSDDEFQNFVNYLQENSLYASEYTPNGEIIILSTCNRAYGENNRLLICAGRES